MLITFEGGEGSGKTTMLSKTKSFLEKRDMKVKTARDPGCVPISEDIRHLTQKPRKEKVDKLTELLLFEAARAQSVKDFLIPSLNQDFVVLMDRFYDSSIAYQGFGRGIDVEFIQMINKKVSCGLKPDRTYILDVPPSLGMKRAKKEEFESGDRIEREKIEFHEKVREGFLSLSKKHERCKLIDTKKKNKKEVFSAIKIDLKNLLNN